MSKRDAQQLVNDLRAYLAETKSPLTVEKRSGHWHVVTPAGHSRASFASTPSDHRFRANTISVLRRRGIVPPGWRG